MRAKSTITARSEMRPTASQHEGTNMTSAQSARRLFTGILSMSDRRMDRND